MKSLSIISLIAGLALTTAVTAAQERNSRSSSEGEKIRIAIVYGDDIAPEAESENEIVVIARLPESERYRVPDIFRGSGPDDPRNQAWTQKITALERVGRFGTESCSTSGLGGFTGCQKSLIASAVAERQAENRADWKALVAEERRKRMKEFDVASEEVEAVVIAEEQAMEARRLAVEAAEAKAQAEAQERKYAHDTPSARPTK